MKINRVVIISLTTAVLLACQALILPVRGTPSPGATSIPLVVQTSSADSSLLHFDNQWVSFDYPRELKAYAPGDQVFRWYPELDLGGELLAGLGDPKVYAYQMYFRSIRIMRRAMPSDQTLQTLMAGTYDRINQQHPINAGAQKASGPVTISGMPAYQKTYRVFSGEPAYDLRDIWVPHDGVLDIIAIATAWHNPDDFARFELLADGIINSLVIK
jgi:hypothetical protein